MWGNNNDKRDLPLSPSIGILGVYNLDDGMQLIRAWEFLEKKLAEIELDKRSSIDIRLIEEAA